MAVRDPPLFDFFTSSSHHPTPPSPLTPLSLSLFGLGVLLSISLSFCCVSNAVSLCLQKQKNIAGALAFWMANASELLNFVKQDKDLSRITLDAQDVLAHLVQMAFK